MAKSFVPHDYQQEAIEHVYNVRRNALWMPMGSGKSVTTLTALDRLSLVEDVFPALILGPKRVIRSTWPGEVEKWRHLAHLRVSVITGTAKQRLAALNTPADLYCMNYELLDWLLEQEGPQSGRFRTFVADEHTKLKSFRLRQGGSRARALAKLMAFDGRERFIGLTGTPAPNGIKDLWGSQWFVDQGQRLGKTFSAFEQRWFTKGYDGYSLQPQPHAQGEIEALLRDVCLTVTGLPVDEPVERIIHVDLPPKVRQMYDDMEREMFVAIEREGVGRIGRALEDNTVEVEAPNAAAKVNKCRQIANGFIFHEGGTEWEELHSAKLEALESICEEANGMPVLCAYVYVPDRERIRRADRSARVLDDDPDTIRRWNRGQIPLLLAHPASAGHGLNLQDGGNILADFGVDWNLEHDAQVIERIGPMRQKQAGYDRPVFRYRIIARDTIEESILERLRGKRSVQEVLLEAMRARK